MVYKHKVETKWVVTELQQHEIKYCEDCGKRVCYRQDTTGANGLQRAYHVTRRNVSGAYLRSVKPHQCTRNYVIGKTYSKNKEQFIG